ncbi:unnamed protein product [Prorocentrum cordatum]|uniref:Uncharacterized protein n=1 Tax=Prorocentrum cordatum TaxID=2364126 RepID=A0ABN9WW48_9DINO|nr:unnamed protein product [Polarella glacialis]
MGRGGRRGPTVRHGAALASVGTLGEAAELMLLLQAKEQSAEAQRLVGCGAELVAALGRSTLAKGLEKLRDQGRRPPPHLERAWRGIDTAASLLRHPGMGDEALDQARARLSAGGEAHGMSKLVHEEADSSAQGPRENESTLKQKSSWQELLGEKMLELEAAKAEHKQSIEQKETELLEAMRIKAQLVAQNAELLMQLSQQYQEMHVLGEMLDDSKQRAKQMETETRDLANVIDEQGKQIEEREEALDNLHMLAPLVEVPAFPALGLLHKKGEIDGGEGQSRNVEQQNDGDAQWTEGHTRSFAEGQGRKLYLEEAEESIEDGQVRTVDAYLQVALGSQQSIAECQGCPQCAHETEQSDGDAQTVHARWGAAQTTPSWRAPRRATKWQPKTDGAQHEFAGQQKWETHAEGEQKAEGSKRKQWPSRGKPEWLLLKGAEKAQAANAMEIPRSRGQRRRRR